MGWPQFLAWAATQGFKNIKLLRQAYNSFKKFPGKDVILKKAKNLLDDVIKKTSTKDLTKQIRDKPLIPKELNKFTPKIVKNKWTDKQGQTWMRDEKGNPIQITEGLGKYKWWKAQADAKRKIVPKTKIVPKKPDTLKDILQGKPHIDKQGRSWEFQKVPHPKGPAKIIPFPKIPRKPKADGGRIDKALPGRSRDI